MDIREKIVRKYYRWPTGKLNIHMEQSMELMSEHASPLKERIKELEEQRNDLVNSEIPILIAKLKEADSKAVRLLNWMNENEESILTYPRRANLWLYKGKEINSDELLEIFESENK